MIDNTEIRYDSFGSLLFCLANCHDAGRTTLSNDDPMLRAIGFIEMGDNNQTTWHYVTMSALKNRGSWFLNCIQSEDTVFGRLGVDGKKLPNQLLEPDDRKKLFDRTPTSQSF